MTKLVLFSGLVQGVGFRATAERIARHHPVHGWVRNLLDGRVELLAVGETDAVENFLGELRRRMANYIHREEILDQEKPEGLEGFRIVW